MPRFLRQLKTGRVYPYTDELATRKDMVAYDPETAKKRIEAVKMRIEAQAEVPTGQSISQDALDDAKTLSELEAELDKSTEESPQNTEISTEKKGPKTQEDLRREERQSRIDKDPDVIKINKMKKKAEIEQYILVEYGEEIDASISKPDLRKKAIELRTQRIFEEK